MEIKFLRSSSYNQFEYCQMSYYITYNLGIRSRNTIKTNYGTVTHKVLEGFANCKKTIQDNPKKKDLSFKDEEMGILNFNEDSIMSEDFVKELTDKSYEYYRINNPHLDHNVKKDYKFCRSMVDVVINHNDGQYDPRKQNIVATEPLFSIPIDEEWAKFDYNGELYQLEVKGSIDLITEINKDTAQITDWKTSATRKNWATGETKEEKDFYNDFQLLLYSFSAHKMYPQYSQFIPTIYFIQAGGPYSLCFDESHKKKVLSKMKDRLYEILKCKLPKPINKWRSDFRCTRLCQFYKDNWPGTETRICNYVEDHIKLYGIDKTSVELKEKNHSVSHYQAPGSI